MMAGGRTSRRLPLAVALAAPLTLLLSTVVLLTMMAAAAGIAPIDLPYISAYIADNHGGPDKEQAAPSLPSTVPPASDPAALRPMSRADAVAVNATIPVGTMANPAAYRFLASHIDIGSWGRSLECLTAAVYYEAASEGVDGQRAVAQVVLNRVRHPAYPHTICGVVFQGSERRTGCQLTFTCDGSLARAPSRTGWVRAQGVAGVALGGYVYAPVGWSTHYHTDWVVPYWASTLVKTAVVGAHIFYRWDGGWGRASAFTARYAGGEPALDWRRHVDFVDVPDNAMTGVVQGTGGVPIANLKDRPVIERSASDRQAAGQQKYVSAERRWVLGGAQPLASNIEGSVPSEVGVAQ